MLVLELLHGAAGLVAVHAVDVALVIAVPGQLLLEPAHLVAPVAHLQRAVFGVGGDVDGRHGGGLGVAVAVGVAVGAACT